LLVFPVGANATAALRSSSSSLSPLLHYRVNARKLAQMNSNSIGNTTGNAAAGETTATADNTAAAEAAAAFPGYPRSGGLLLPQLQPLLLAIQQARLYNDSKTAV
jgi:hypothetical protein